jgi:hypothetical protein
MNLGQVIWNAVTLIQGAGILGTPLIFLLLFVFRGWLKRHSRIRYTAIFSTGLFVIIFAFTYYALIDMSETYTEISWRYIVHIGSNYIATPYDHETVYHEMFARALLPSEFNNRCYTNDEEICSRYEQLSRMSNCKRYPWTDFWYNLLGSVLGGITAMMLLTLLGRTGRRKKKRFLSKKADVSNFNLR